MSEINQQNISNSKSAYKFYIYFAVFLILASLATIYCQKIIVENKKKHEVQKAAYVLQHEVENSFTAYNAMLKSICRKIVAQELAQTPSMIPELLKLYYISSKEKDARIPVTDIIWHFASNDAAKNRYGNVFPLKIPTDIENSIKNAPTKAHLYELKIPNNTQDKHELYLSRAAVVDNDYLGKVTLLLDMSSWTQGLEKKLSNQKHVLVVYNTGKEPIFSTQELSTSNVQRMILAENFKIESLTFSYGYLANNFYSDIMAESVPLLILLWLSGILYFLYHHYAIKHAIAKNSADIMHATKNLRKSKLKQANEYKLNIQDMEEHVSLVTAKLESEQLAREAMQTSYRAKKVLEEELMQNFIAEIVDLKMIPDSIIKGVYGEIDAPITAEKLIELLTKMHGILDELSTCCPVAKSKEVLHLKPLFDDVIKIFADKIYIKKLSINIDVERDMKEFVFNKLQFKQIMANLLAHAMFFARPKGYISIYAQQRDQKFVIIIEDNGYFLDDEYTQDVEEPASWLKINIDKMKYIIEARGGYLSYSIGDPKIITLIFPYPKDSLPTPELVLIPGGNVVPFKKS